MADAPLDARATVSDGRAPAKGLLPSRLLAWIAFGVAALLTLVSVVTNLRATKKPPAVKVEKEYADDPKRLGGFRTQLDSDAERARALASTSAPATVSDPKKTVRRAGGGDLGAGASFGDTDKAARLKREEDRLYASTMVVSRRPVAEAGPGPAGRMGGRLETAVPAPADASLDETVAAVMRQARAGQSAGSFPVPAAPVTPSQTPAAGDRATTKPERPTRTPPISAAGPLHLLLESTVLDATLVHRLDGTNNSPVKAVISGPVFSHNRQFVLIPDGTTALGTARAVQNYNESRLAVTFHRLEFPDGSTVSLELDPGLNQAGDVGVHDKVNNHYVATFGRAAAVGVLQGLGQAVGYRGFGGNGDNRTVIVASDVGNTTSNAFNNLLNKMPLPSVEIREGHRLKIYLTHDLELPTWSRTGEVRPVR